MRRITALFLALLMTCSLVACGQKDSADTPAQDGDPAQAETPDTSAEPEEPQPEPYIISSPTIDRGTVDGVNYVAWDGVVEHLFFHPIVAYPELAFDGDSQSDGIDDWMVTVEASTTTTTCWWTSTTCGAKAPTPAASR